MCVRVFFLFPNKFPEIHDSKQNTTVSEELLFCSHPLLLPKAFFTDHILQCDIKEVDK